MRGGGGVLKINERARQGQKWKEVNIKKERGEKAGGGEGKRGVGKEEQRRIGPPMLGARVDTGQPLPGAGYGI